MRQRFTARSVVVGDRAGTVVPDAVLDVDDGRIAWVGPASEAPPVSSQVTALPGILLPGLVNTHSHAPMVLFRGQGEGLRWTAGCGRSCGLGRPGSHPRTSRSR